MKVKKIIFSPTGGTEKVASIIAKNISEDITNIDLCNPNLDFQNVIIDESDIVIIAMPSYGGRAPKPAIERLKQIQGNQAKCIIVCVYGNRAYEDTLAEMEDAANDANFKVIAAIAAIAEHSIMHQYATGRPDSIDVENLTNIVQDILNKNKDKISNIPGNRPYKKAMGASVVPQPNKNCVKCGLCAKACPVKAIDPVTFKADKHKCISCMRCIKVCPHNAREVNKLLVSAAAMAIKKACTQRKECELFLTDKILED